MPPALLSPSLLTFSPSGPRADYYCEKPGTLKQYRQWSVPCASLLAGTAGAPSAIDD